MSSLACVFDAFTTSNMIAASSAVLSMTADALEDRLHQETDAMRHAERLVQLAPYNPASHEIMLSVMLECLLGRLSSINLAAG